MLNKQTFYTALCVALAGLFGFASCNNNATPSPSPKDTVATSLWITQACFEKFARFAPLRPEKHPSRATSFCHISATNGATHHVHMLCPPLFFGEFMQK